MNNFQSHECKPTSKEIDTKVEQEVQNWIENQHPRKVPSTEIREKAREIYRKHGRSKIECSYGWYRRFKVRMGKKKGMPVTSKNMHEEEDALVLTWLLGVYDNNQVVSYKDVQNYAQTALMEIKPKFKASTGWVLRFLKRNHILINWDYGIYRDHLPTALECHVGQCKNQIRDLLTQFPGNCIGCMDEIPLSFVSPTSTSNKPKLGRHQSDEEDEEQDSSRISRLKKLSVTNSDATVVLGMLADGTLLPPMVIVKVNDYYSDMIKITNLMP